MSTPIEKLDLQSPDLVNDNFEKLARLFPNCVTESADGKAIDFDLLKQELSHAVVDGNKERYRLEWPGKREAIVTANLPTSKTLRPVREDSVDFDNTENLYIEGDNLEVLKLLQESFLNKVKMIYIDPPYNTGRDFVYKDNFTQDTGEYKEESGQADEFNQRLVANPDTSGRYHSDWLSMIYPRLKLARNLLTNDGVICISIDDNEFHNLRSVCDSVFGLENFCATMIWQGGRKNDSKRFSVVHDYILVYVKNEDVLKEKGDIWREKKQGLDLVYKQIEELKAQFGDNYELATKALRNWFDALPEGSLAKDHSHYRFLDAQGAYFGDNISSPNFRKNLLFEYKGYQPPKNGWRYNLEAMKRLDKEGLLLFPDSKEKRIQYKRYLHHTETWAPSTHFYKDRRTASKSLTSLMGGDYFDFPKDVDIIARLINTFTEKNDIIFDFFAGSSTTAHSVLQLNKEDDGKRKYIQVQLPEQIVKNSEAYKAGFNTICDISKERIRRAARAIKEEKLEKAKKDSLFADFKDDQDYGFRVYRLDESNMQDVYYKPQDYSQDNLKLFEDNVKPDRTPDDLLAQIMLDWGLPLSLNIEQVTIAGKKLFKVAGNSLYACFDQGIDEAFAKEIAVDAPLRIVFRDSGFKNDTAKTNVKQLLKQLSPETEMKVI